MEKPDILILDEPTKGIDKEHVIKIRNIIKEYKNLNATILIASHDEDDINMLCDEIFKIENGKI